MTLNSAISSMPKDASAGAFRFGPFQLSGRERLLQQNGRPLSISSRALEILIALVERPGEVVSHKELISRAWPNVVVEDTNLRVHIASLRRILGDTKAGPRYIMSVPGRGYCFVAKVDLTDSSRSVEWPNSPLPRASNGQQTDALVVAEGQVHLGVHLLRNALATLQAQQCNVGAAEFSRALADGLAQCGQIELAASALEFLVRSQAGDEEQKVPDILRSQTELWLGYSS
ncbi:transcriptional regulator [Phyllobacterium sp. LjRoot231]|uniref:winged helix-turn-helix domain-containing protein n=1 Tax=Phyllobacterium sp. LjRoot231 TaxID=3342289 RepID=UPI003ECFF5E2